MIPLGILASAQATSIADVNFIALPLTYREEDAEAVMTWVRQGNGPHVTPQGFEGDGYSARLKSTTIPTWMASASRPLTLHASMSFYPQQTRAAYDYAVFLGANSSSGAKLRLSIQPDATNPRIPQAAVLATLASGSWKVQFGRSGWRYEFRTPELEVGGYQARPQMVGFIDSDTLLMSVHFEDTKSRIYKVRLSDAEVLGYFDSDTYTHVGVCAKRSNGDWWVSLGGGSFGRVDLDASFSGGSIVLLDTCVFSGITGGGPIEFVTVSGTEYVVIGEYRTSGTPYFYVYPAASLGSVTLAASARFKRFTGCPIEAQGLCMRDGLLYTSSVAMPGAGTGSRYGYLGTYDIAAAIASSADGAAITALATYDGPSKYCEDLAAHPVTGDIWTVTEGLTAVGSDVGFLSVWSSPLDGSLVENHYTIEYDGDSTTTCKLNNRIFDTASGELVTDVAAVCIGGPPTASAGFDTGYFAGFVRNVVLQDQPMTTVQYEAAVNGDHEPNALEVFDLTLTNPGAEAGSSPTGWTNETGGLAVLTYPTTIVVPHSGTRFFTGGTSASTIARQRLDILAQTGLSGGDVDSGNIWAKVRWWQAGHNSATGDPAGMGLRTLNASDVSLGEVYSAIVHTPNSVSPYFPWYSRAFSAALPSGARSLDVLQRMTRSAGTNNDGWIDDISVTIYRK